MDDKINMALTFLLDVSVIVICITMAYAKKSALSTDLFETGVQARLFLYHSLDMPF